MVKLRELKDGALLHVLVGLLRHGPCKKAHLGIKTGWSPEAIQSADPDYGLVYCMPNGRWPIWGLTPAGHQMFLPTDAVRLPEILIPLPAGSDGSSSGSYDSERGSIDTPLLPPVIPLAAGSLSTAVDNFAPPPAVEALVQMLLQLGCPRDRARPAIAAALHRGQEPGQIAQAIVACKQFAASPEGRRFIKTPAGFWAAACLTDGRAIPEVPLDADDPRRFDSYRKLLNRDGDEEENP